MSTLDRHRDAQSGTARSPEAPAARFARARVSARSWLIAGAVLMPVILGAFWLKSGHIDRLAVFVTIGVTTLVDMIGVAQLLMLGRAMERHRRRIATKNLFAAADPVLSNLARAARAGDRAAAHRAA